MISDDKYTLVHQHESAGQLGDLGVKILISCNKDLSEDTISKIRTIGDNIYGALEYYVATNTPDFSDTKREWIAELRNLFPSPIFSREVPNQYCSQACCLHKPWLCVATSKGPITVGPRKRVIEISWDESDITRTADELFPEESVAKQGRSIRAWGMEKAKEYITKLLA